MMVRHAAKWLAKPTILIVTAALLTGAQPDGRDAEAVVAAPEQARRIAPGTAVDTVTAFHAALANGDRATALGLLADDVVIFESGGVESSRAEYASHHLEADAAFSAAVPRTLISRTQGETADSAWVLSVEAINGTFRGRAIDSRSVETMLLRRVEGHWRIAHIHWSSADFGPREP